MHVPRFLQPSLERFFGRDEEYPVLCFLPRRAHPKLFDQEFGGPVHVLLPNLVGLGLPGKGVGTVVDDEDVGVGQTFANLEMSIF